MLTIARYATGEVQVRDKRNTPNKTYKFDTETLFKDWYDRNIKSNQNRPL